MDFRVRFVVQRSAKLSKKERYEARGGGLKLFQYWNDITRPADVARWIGEIRKRNPELDHVLLD